MTVTPARYQRHLDLWLVGTTMFLMVVGLWLVSDTSYVNVPPHQSVLQYAQLQIRGQIIGAVFGTFCMILFMAIPYGKLRKVSGIGVILGIALLVAVWLPHLGIRLNDSNRWVRFGPIHLESSEFAKLALILVTASVLADDRKTHPLSLLGAWIVMFKTILPRTLRRKVPFMFYQVSLVLFLSGICLLLIDKEPDLGTAAVVLAAVLTQLYLGGVRIKYIASLVAAALVLVATIGLHGNNVQHRIHRIEVYLHPNMDPQGIGYQVMQAKLAVGSGSWTGVGLGKGRQKYYLPQANSDNIFATYAEETGFVGDLILLGSLCIFTWRAYIISMNAPDRFGTLFAGGIGALISLQAALNIAVVTGTVPATGVPLPFISHGSSSLILSLCAVGILLNIGSSKAPPKPVELRGD